MKFFKHLYLFYLSLIPALALGAMGFGDYDGLHKIWWFFLFLGVIIYLDLLVEVAPLPTKKSHLFALASIPVQLGVALYNSETLWNIFAYHFLVQTIAMLLVLVYIAVTKITDNKSNLIKKSAVVLLLLLLPAYAIFQIFGPLFIKTPLSFTTFFLATALYTNIATLYAASNQENRGDKYFGYIIVGIFAFMFLGPALFHMVKNTPTW